MSYIKIIFIVIAIYYALKLFVRYLFPLILIWFVKRMAKKTMNNFFQQSTNFKNNNEGEVTIKYKPNIKKKFKSDNSEYIGFEEVKD